MQTPEDAGERYGPHGARRGPGGGRHAARSEVTQFLIAGGLAYAVDVAVFNLCLYWGLGGVAAKTVSGPSRPRSSPTSATQPVLDVPAVASGTGVRREYTMFFVFSAIAAGIQAGCVFVSNHLMGYPSTLADNISGNIVGMALGTLFRFWAFRTFVFKHKSGDRARDRTRPVRRPWAAPRDRAPRVLCALPPPGASRRPSSAPPGGLGVVVNILVFNLLPGNRLDLAPVRSSIISTAVAIVVNYVGNRFWAFRHRKSADQRREVLLFLLFSGVGMAIESGRRRGVELPAGLANDRARPTTSPGTKRPACRWAHCSASGSYLHLGLHRHARRGNRPRGGQARRGRVHEGVLTAG
ncbi:GtrA family protein [Yinghuangia aomiensis]